jgi:hypothetical protein
MPGRRKGNSPKSAGLSASANEKPFWRGQSAYWETDCGYGGQGKNFFRFHHAKRLKPILERYREQIDLIFLPTYSPDLNPVERVWWVNAEAGYSAEKHTSTSIFDRELKSPTVGKYGLLFSVFLIRHKPYSCLFEAPCQCPAPHCC